MKHNHIAIIRFSWTNMIFMSLKRDGAVIKSLSLWNYTRPHKSCFSLCFFCLDTLEYQTRLNFRIRLQLHYIYSEGSEKKRSEKWPFFHFFDTIFITIQITVVYRINIWQCNQYLQNNNTKEWIILNIEQVFRTQSAYPFMKS